MLVCQNCASRSTYGGGVNSSLEDASPDVGGVDGTRAGGHAVRADGALGSKGVDGGAASV